MPAMASEPPPKRLELEPMTLSQHEVVDRGDDAGPT